MDKNTVIEVVRRNRAIDYPGVHNVCFPDKSEERSRGFIAELLREGLLGSSEFPKRRNARFLFPTKKGCRRIGKSSRYTNASRFKPRSFYECRGYTLFATETVLEPGIEGRPILFPSELEKLFPKLAPNAPDRYYALENDATLYALQVVGLAASRRIITNAHSKFRKYLLHPAWLELVKADAVKLALIVPSKEKADSLTAELDLRELQLQKQKKPDQQRIRFEKAFRRSLHIAHYESLLELIT